MKESVVQQEGIDALDESDHSMAINLKIDCWV
jgi:hypothetical protein